MNEQSFLLKKRKKMSENNPYIEKEDVGISMKKPFDPQKIKIRLQTIPIYSMAERIEHKEVKLDTEFQRKEGLWNDAQQSRLIESVLIRFPLPVFYFDGSNPNEWLVIDGLQRLTAIKRFMVTRELQLTGLEFMTFLEGKGWDDLERQYQRQINETSLQCYVLEESEEDVKFNIFKRINTGGLTLSSQEIRHAMHQDVAGYLKKLAELPEFIHATKGRISTERMQDRDFINRFLAFFILDPDADYTYEDDLDSFMNKALDKLARLEETEREKIEYRFKEAMILSEKLFGDSAFCKQVDYKRINKALFEVMSVSFARMSVDGRGEVLQRKDTFKALFYKAIDDSFANSLTSNTGGKSNVTLRYKTFQSIIDQTLKN